MNPDSAHAEPDGIGSAGKLERMLESFESVDARAGTAPLGMSAKFVRRSEHYY